MMLDRLAGVGSHVAHCTGLPQLVYLAAALELAGVDPADVVVRPHGGTAANDAVLSAIGAAARGLGMTVATTEPPPGSRARVALERLLRRRRTAFWFCRGFPADRNVLDNVARTLPDRLIEYYDGYRSPLVARDERSPLLRRVRRLGVDNWIVTRLLRPDAYVMPRGRMWGAYAGRRALRRTAWMPQDALQRSFARVSGAWLQENPLDAGPAPALALATGMFSERKAWCSLEDEVSLYRDMLRVAREVGPEARLLVKTHPRSSPEKTAAVAEACRASDAEMLDTQVPMEYVLERRGAAGTAVVAPPSTTLLNAGTFGHGKGYCISVRLLSAYLGDHYRNQQWSAEDDVLMQEAGVQLFDDMDGLRRLLGAHFHSSMQEKPPS